MAITDLLKSATLKVIGYPAGGILIAASFISFFNPNATTVTQIVSIILAIIGVALWLAASRS